MFHVRIVGGTRTLIQPDTEGTSMSDTLSTIAALLALIAAYPVLILADVLRRPDRAPAPFQVLAPVQTGYTGGTPYVVG
jgi:hypothetical protein